MKPRRIAAANTVAIVGTGLIGTSVGLALRASGKSDTIIGWDSSKAALKAAERIGGIHQRAASLRDAVAHAGTIVVATPLGAILASLPAIVRLASPGAFLVELGGLKQPVDAAIRPHLRKRPDIAFASGHPMAGSEKAGAAHASAALFAGRAFIVTIPRQRAEARALARARAFVRRLRARSVLENARDHDRLVAAVSALPQLASMALALAVSRSAAGDARACAGPAYRDATRLAESPFAIWAPVLAANSKGIWKALRVYEGYVADIRAAIARQDIRSLGRIFRLAAAARRRVAGG